MRCVGICVRLPRRGRPTAEAVVLDGCWEAPTPHAQFELTSAKDDLPTLLHDLAAGLVSQLAGLNVDRVAIRRADQPARASNREGPRIRLLAEGALASAARSKVRDVLLRSGRDLAARSPAGTKAQLDAYATRSAPGTPTEAAAAALSGLVP